MSNKTYLKVTKKPRDKPIVDRPIKFEPLQNLHLELIEVKSKLKPGLPLIPQSAPKMRPIPSTNTTTTESTTSTTSTTKNTVDTAVKSKDKENKINLPKSIVIDTIIDKNEGKRENFEKDSSVKNRDNSIKHKDKIKQTNPVKTAENIVKNNDKNKIKQPTKKEETEDEEEIEENEVEEEKEEIVEEGEEEEVKNEEIQPEEEKVDEDDPYAGLSPEEREIKEKEEYIWRFRILKKQYGKHATIEIPSWNEHSDLHMMKTSYERTIRELYLDDAVETYKTYLIGGWIVMEYVCTQMIGIDLRGFTVYQIQIMYKYERMLIELGEKSYTRWGMNLPVEVRLIGMILFQAGIFYLAKIISDKFGSNLAEIFRGFTGQPPPSNNSNGNNKENDEIDDNENDGKKMKGPKIKADDIRRRRAEKTS